MRVRKKRHLKIIQFYFEEGLHVILGYRREKSHSAKSEFEQQFLTHTNEQTNK